MFFNSATRWCQRIASPICSCIFFKVTSPDIWQGGGFLALTDVLLFVEQYIHKGAVLSSEFVSQTWLWKRAWLLCSCSLRQRNRGRAVVLCENYIIIYLYGRGIPFFSLFCRCLLLVLLMTKCGLHFILRGYTSTSSHNIYQITQALNTVD